MVNRDDARDIADAYAARTGSCWFDRRLEKGATYWIAYVGFIGSWGVVIDESDGRLTVASSGPPEDWLWAYERGLLERDVTLRVLAVHDEKKTIELLRRVAAGGPEPSRSPWPRRVWMEQRLRELPADVRLKETCPLMTGPLKTVLAEGWFDFEILSKRRPGIVR